MQAIRTILWVLLAIVMVAFIAINWVAVPVNIWPSTNGTYLHFNWPIGFVILISFLLGLLPMWLLHKGASWRWNRRIGTLENSVRAASTTAQVAVPVAPHPGPTAHEPAARVEPPASTL